jgi:hypothetical protein
MHAQWQLTLLWGVLVGTGTGVTSMVLAAIMANRWFDERRGLVLGILSAGQRHGAADFPAVARRSRRIAWLALGALCSSPARQPCVFANRADLHARSAGGPRIAPVRASGRSRRSAASPPRTAAGARRRVANARLLAPGGDVLRLRRKHERPHRNASHRRLPRLRHSRGAVGTAARNDGESSTSSEPRRPAG